MSTSAEIVEVFESTVAEHQARIALVYDISLDVGERARREEKRAAMYAARSRRRVYRCGHCGGFGHNQRVCSAEARKRMRGKPEEHLEFVSRFLQSLHTRMNGPDLRAAIQPFNPAIDKDGTWIVAVRMSADDGRHLVGLLELSEFGARVTYSAKVYRARLDTIAARLLEQFG